MLLAAGIGPVGSAGAQSRDGHIEVVQVQGAIDPVVADLVSGALRRAQDNGATVVILQVDSPGALDVDPLPIVRAVAASRVPVAAWAGPSRSSARGAAAALLLAADVAAIASGASVGPALPLRLDRTGGDARGGPALRRLAEATGDPAGARDTAARRLGGEAAVEAGAADFVAPTLGDVLLGLDGRDVTTAAGTVRLSTTRVVDTDEGPRQTANQPVRFHKPGTLAGVQHSLTSPAVAYLLLVVGLALVVFEFFTIGIGLAGLVGAGALAGAFFGFSHLPVTWWGVALVALSAFGFAVDVQAGTLGFWTGVGVAGLVAGSLALYGGSPLLDVPLWLVALLVVGQTVFMLSGMTVAVRNRFAVPTVGRDSMVGEVGEARTDLDPDGVVLVRGAPWRARTNRATPVTAGGSVRVVAVDRLVLEVEPAEG